MLNSQFPENVSGSTRPAEAPRDLVFYLPLGMLGDVLVADKCPPTLVETHPEATGCPPGSKIGSIVTLVGSAGFIVEHGIYNVPPERGYAAEFAFTSNGFTFFSYVSVVRRDGTYEVRISTPGVPDGAQLVGLVATIYGDIKESYISREEEQTFDRGPLLTNPSDCGAGTGGGEATMAMDTFEHPAVPFPVQTPAPFETSSVVFPNVEGCSLLSFSTGLGVVPETTRADAPSGYTIGVEAPQAPNDFTGLGTPPYKRVSVTLPAGTALSPSAANGLGVCQETGAEGIDIEGPESEAVGADGLLRPVAGHCPASSRVANVRASVAALSEELHGSYLPRGPQMRCSRAAGVYPS